MAKIVSINAPASSCPVSDTIRHVSDASIDYNRRVWFASEAWSIPFDVPSGPIILSKETAELTVGLSIPNGSSGLYTLSASISNQALSGPLSFTVDGNTGNQVKKLPILPPSLPGGKEKPVPWAFAGPLSITLANKSGSPIHMVKAHVEIYVLTSKLPKFYQTGGIPYSLLKLESLLPEWMGSASDNWPAFVISDIFHDKRLEYEVYKGSPKYCSYSAGDNLVDIHCWLDLWLSDVTGLATRGNRASKYPLNCYDCASIAQAIITLGAEQTKTKAIYLKPYGYIAKTHLIGRKEVNATFKAQNPENYCNNPFYGSIGCNPRMLCDPDAHDRSGFGNHMFLTFDYGTGPVVLDACAGPETGTKTRETYVATAIDQNTKLTGAPKGTVSNMQTGEGISQLSQTAYFTDKHRVVTEESIFTALKQAFEGSGALEEPYLSAMTHERGIVVTWTFTPVEDREKHDKDTVWLNIYQYTDPQTTQNEWTRRKDSLDDFVKVNDESGYTDYGTGALRIFYIANDKQIVTVESKVRKAKQLKSIEDKVRNVLHGLNASPLTSTLQIKSSTKPTSQKVHSNFEWKVEVDPTTSGHWRGYRVEVSSEAALFLNAVVDEHQNVTFKFRARSVGTVTLSPFLFDERINETEIGSATVTITA